MYPTKMEANGHIYPINTDYRVALACFRALDDDEITFTDYVDLSEQLSKLNKEMFRIVMR